MLRYLYTFFFLGIAFGAKAQTTSQNYTKEIIYIDGSVSGNRYTTTTYQDGLGRPIQQVQHNLSPVADKNIVTHIEYDKNVGQTKTYLPFAALSDFTDNAGAQTVAYYNTPKYGNTTNPYSQELREASPAQRVLETAAPGTDWAMDNPEKHTIRYQYDFNTANEVKQFTLTTTWSAAAGMYTNSLSEVGFYAANSLHKTVVKNENWKAADGKNNTTEEFKGTDGKVLLKRAYNNGVAHDTYYLYDFYGNLAYVLPPLANGGIGTTTLNDLCYQYRYDERNRLVEKKLPGKDWEYIVYDQADRIVMTGPALSPFGSGLKGWLFTKYDVMDRVVYTGYYNGHTPTSANRKVLKDLVYGQTQLNEVKTSSNGTINGVTVRYSNTVFPTTGAHLLTVNYYDNYEFPGAPASFPAIEGATPVTAVKGLVTGNWVRVITTTSEYKASVSYILYNAKYQPLRNFTQNHLGGYTQTDSKLTFRGLPVKTVTKHKRTAAASELTVTDTYTYDNRERLLQHIQKTGSNPEALIARNTYDELGVLESKKVGGLATAAKSLQDVSYKYNVRGWLTDLNDLYARNRQLFSFRLTYNTIFLGDTSQPQYNGNIASVVWNTLVDNTAKGYGYDYDHLNRLNYASHLKQTRFNSGELILLRYNRDGQFAEDLTYDKNGNIQTLKRFGKEEAGQPIDLDELSYTYQGNRLMSVTDATNNSDGFNDGNTTGNDYTYDSFGNMTADKNKGITAITYNHLNLPVQITFTGGTINYTYDAAGTRMAKTVTPTGGSAQTTDYLGGFQYLNSVLQFFPHPEGYVKHENNTYLYVYQYKDHLGNVRLSYADCNGDGQVTPTEIIEENNYYPFGLKHQGYNDIANSCGNEQAQKNKFLDREYESSFGLNVTETDFRQYDSALGRFYSIDALSEHSFDVTPYHYALNNPVYWADPTGLIYEPFWNSIWTNSPEGKNTFWSNMGGYFVSDQMNANELFPAVYYDGTVAEVLSMMYVEVKAGGSGGINWSSLGGFNIGRRIQDHVYRNSSLYQYHRDQMEERQMDEFQEGMDYLGTFDPTFLVDGLNGLGYLYRGQYGNAAIAGIAMVPFVGDLGKLVKIQRHHIIPKAVYRDASEAVKKAMNLDAGNNLKKLPTPFHGNHPQYSSYVTDQLNALDKVTPGSIQTLQKNLNSMINNAYDNYKATGQNLNDYFRQFNNN